MPPTRTIRLTVTLVAAGLLVAGLLAACGGASSGGGSAHGSATPTPAVTTAPAVLHVLVTNDDGVGAPGLDTIVNALRALPNIQVDVVAPATNQSGQGGKTAPDPTYQAARTASGVAATSVDGHPADTITVALDKLGLKPDVVVSGINLGQNLGPFVDLSGTVGAARAAARRGLPALAVSQGLAATFDYPTGAKFAISWVTSHRAAILAHTASAATVANLNVPSCSAGSVRGEKELRSEAKITNPAEALKTQNCASTATPATEVDAFNDGFATLTAVSPSPAG